MPIYKLDKIVVSVRGSAEKFLSGLTSNTLDAPHNAFLNMLRNALCGASSVLDVSPLKNFSALPLTLTTILSNL